MQARSTARLAALLDSAAAVIDEIGYERLTTAMVAERAGASIGTVYRYFPDRIVVLQGLSARFLQQFSASTARVILASKHEDWLDAVDSCLADIITAFRRQPGFRSLRFGDVLDLAPVPTGTSGLNATGSTAAVRPTAAAGTVTGTGVIAGTMADALAERYGLESDDLAFHLEVALTFSDALLTRAFRGGGKGDDRFIAEARSAVRSHLAGVYGASA